MVLAHLFPRPAIYLRSTESVSNQFMPWIRTITFNRDSKSSGEEESNSHNLMNASVVIEKLKTLVFLSSWFFQICFWFAVFIVGQAPEVKKRKHVDIETCEDSCDSTQVKWNNRMVTFLQKHLLHTLPESRCCQSVVSCRHYLIEAKVVKSQITCFFHESILCCFLVGRSTHLFFAMRREKIASRESNRQFET